MENLDRDGGYWKYKAGYLVGRTKYVILYDYFLYQSSDTLKLKTHCDTLVIFKLFYEL